MIRAYLSFGSNLGDRVGHLKAGISSLRGEEEVEVVAVSSVYRSEPVGGPEQPEYLNAVVAINTTLGPRELLALAQRIEGEQGRLRKERWGPRTLDVDILLYGDVTVDETGLEIPHPRLVERRFALEPLLEVEPGARLPDGTHLVDFLGRLADDKWVRPDPGLKIGWVLSEMDKGKRVSVIGTGKVGTAVVVVLSSRGYRVLKVCDTDGRHVEHAAKVVGATATEDCVEAARDADIVLITTPDGAIEGVCRRVADSGLEIAGKIFIHMSGAVPLSALESAAGRGAVVLCIHPLQTFADLEGAIRSLPGSTFAVTCPAGLEPWARGFVEDMDGRMLLVKEGDKALYHAAAVIACNLLTMVEFAAFEACVGLGFSEQEAAEAFIPLVHATVENITRIGPVESLTGPLARGDAGTIEANLAALESFDPGIAELYRSVSLYGLRLVAERGELDEDTIEKMRSLLLTRP